MGLGGFEAAALEPPTQWGPWPEVMTMADILPITPQIHPGALMNRLAVDFDADVALVRAEQATK